jgi:hypothetical protein
MATKEPHSHKLIPESRQQPVPPKIADPDERIRRARAVLGNVSAGVAVDTDRAIGR